MAFPVRKITAPQVLIPLAGIAGASLLHYFTPPLFVLWHNVFQRLYYLPIIYAAIAFGLRGGVAAAFISGVCYVPHILSAWHHMPAYTVNQYAELIVFLMVGVTTGILADQGRRKQGELEAATRELERVNRELQDSFEQIKRADRLSAIGQLAAGLAHEIRNPLGSIEGAANIIDSQKTSEETRRNSLAIIRKECRRLNGLLTGLLDFARPRPPEFRPVDLGQVIDSVIALVVHTAERQKISIRRALPAWLPPIQSDAEQLKQVVLNLTINAIQAMPDGGEIVIRAERRDSSVWVSVRDQGQGIGEADIEKIFDPFFTTKEAGTGLGLSVAHQIVTQHGGSIRAVRNLDAGMTFSLILPSKESRHP